MQSSKILTPALSLSESERVNLRPPLGESPFGDRSATREFFSLAPSDGERVGVRGAFTCIVPANLSRSACGQPGSFDQKIRQHLFVLLIRDDAPVVRPELVAA